MTTDNKEKLERFARQLRKLTFPTSPISIDLTRFVAAAIEGYLRGDHKSLDSAFGLTAKRGAPRRQDDEHEKLARRVFTLRELDDKSWWEVMNELATEGNILDERTIRGIYREKVEWAYIKHLQERIDEELDNEGGGNK